MSNDNKNKIHKFFPTIYPRKLWISKGIGFDEIKKMFCGYDGEDIDKYWDENVVGMSKAMVFKARDRQSGEYGAFVFIGTKLDIKDIAHESVHVASCIFDDCGMTMGFAGGKDEHFAYLAGFAADCIHQVVTGRFRE